MAEDYANKVVDVVNKGCVAIMLSMAKETGILTILKSATKPLTSTEIAAENNLKERYVRELLGSLCSSGLVHVSTTSEGVNLYHLTDEEKACFDVSSKLWPYIGVPGVMGHVYRQSLSTFDAKGPYGYHYGPEVYQVIEDFAVAGTDTAIGDFLKNIPDLKEKLETGIDVAEFGCGRGIMIAKLAQTFPNSRFTASEYCDEDMEVLRSKHGHIPNLTCIKLDLCDEKYDDLVQFDWTYVCDVIHDLPRPLPALEKLRRMTKKDGGVFSFVEPSLTETGNPEEGVGDSTVASFYAMSVFTCVPQGFENDDSAALGCVYGKQKMKDLAIQAGFLKVTGTEIASEFSLYVCYQT